MSLEDDRPLRNLHIVRDSTGSDQVEVEESFIAERDAAHPSSGLKVTIIMMDDQDDSYHDDEPDTSSHLPLSLTKEDAILKATDDYNGVCRRLFS